MGLRNLSFVELKSSLSQALRVFSGYFCQQNHFKDDLGSILNSKRCEHEFESNSQFIECVTKMYVYLRFLK